ncbi:MAG: DUF4493 domain-containing protein [Phocaeicola sp.]
MGKIKCWFVIFITICCFLSACESEHGASTDSGTVNLNLLVETQTVVGSLSRSNQTEIDAPDVNEFSLCFMQGENEFLVIDKIGEWDSEIALPAGFYRVIVYYGNPTAEGFDLPYFLGETNVTVVPNEVSYAEVTCSLANTVLTFEYSEVFQNYFSSYLATVKTALGNSILLDKEEQRFLYVQPGAVSIGMDLTRQGGTTGYESLKLLVVDDASVEMKTHYNFRFDVDAGGEMLQIAFDDEVVMQPIDISTINAAPPKFTTVGVVQGEIISHPELAEKEITALLSAASGIRKVKLAIHSTFLANLGIPQQEFDLTDVENQETIQLLESLGLGVRGLNSLDKMVWFDFSKLAATLQCVGDEGTHTFTISAIDKIGKTCEALTFTIQSINYPIEVIKSESQIWNIWDEMAYATLRTAGDASKVKAYLLTNGTTQEVAVDASELTSGSYELALALPGSTGECQLRFELGSSVTHLEVAPLVPAYTLSLSNELAVWAKQAYLRVEGVDASSESNVMEHLTLIADDRALPFQADGTEIVVHGLRPGTTYEIVPHCAGVANLEAKLTITTEEALQLPNADMEDWYYTRPSGVQHWEVWYASKEGETSVWNTLNAKTTSEGGTNSGAFAGSNRNGCRYNANSGTIQTTEANSGNSAALIRAVGWGKGNSATGSANSKYGDPGYLYVGSYNSETQSPNYDGMPFNSRPSSLSFYQKYAPGNGGDSYLAEIALFYKNGEEVLEIGRGSVRGSEATTSYQQVTVPITYFESSLLYKPTHLHVLFKSGDKADNASFVKVPSFGNLSTGEFIGSQLYIDDITLNYE